MITVFRKQGPQRTVTTQTKLLLQQFDAVEIVQMLGKITKVAIIFSSTLSFRIA